MNYLSKLELGKGNYVLHVRRKVWVRWLLGCNQDRLPDQ